MSKTIGILTVQKAPNYGAVLQCYALYKYLLNRGYECKVIDLCRPLHPDFKESKGYKPYNYSFGKSIKIKVTNFLKSKLAMFLPSYDFKKRNRDLISRMNTGFDSFNSRIEYTNKYLSIDELYKNPPIFDCYVTGSDQLWNPTQYYCIEPFFLTFAPKGKTKISYSTSVGLSSLPSAILKDYAKWLTDYDAISLREKSAIDLLQPYCSKAIQRTIDPTLLLEKKEWECIAAQPMEKDYVFCFSLSYCDELLQYAIKYSRYNNLKLVYYVHGYKDEILDDVNIIGKVSITPEEWIGFIQNAKCVLTDSFHGSVFSIIFGRAFKTFIPSTNVRGSRITDLFDMLSLQDRLLSDLDSFSEIKEPSYAEARRVIYDERCQSEAFLLSAIEP